MAANDDRPPASYPYFWSSNSELSLEDYLVKYKPSMVQDDGTKPWLWVEKSSVSNLKQNTNEEAALAEAAEYLKEVTEKVENIKNDTSIPVRSNKKKGLKSKKEMREEVQSGATEQLKDISIRHGFVSGKWLIFASLDRVDAVWSTIATSLVSGPLASTCAHLAKVSTCPRNETANYNHVICLYMPDVYDQSSVTGVMKVLLREHAMNLVGVKSDLYTGIGLDSKHASGIQSTVWKNTALLEDSEMKNLKDEYFARLNSGKSNDVQKATAEKVSTGPPVKTKPRFKSKVAEDDPFSSDHDDQKGNENDEGKEATSGGVSKASGSKLPSKVKAKPRKKIQADSFTSDDDDSEEEKRKAEVEARKGFSGKKGVASKRRKDDHSDEETEDQPKKRGRK